MKVKVITEVCGSVKEQIISSGLNCVVKFTSGREFEILLMNEEEDLRSKRINKSRYYEESK